MRKFGPNKTALHFKRQKNQLESNAQPQEDDPAQYRLEEGDGSSHAQEIVKELYVRYEKQLQRWRDYRNLFGFLSFVAWFLAVLYLQRNSDVAFKVHNTIASVVLPTDDSGNFQATMQDTDSVYNWLQGLLSAVWVDPKCGDGLCETPFEFASYGRFGCRADCGKLSEVQNLTKIQIDIYYDFSHPVGSTPASDLMQQASWNLCPVDTQYSSACYYDTDVTFDNRLSGTQYVPLDDAPDGVWSLVIRRDTFNKVGGAVRDTTLVYASAYYYKLYISAAAAFAEHNTEVALLQRANDIARTPYWTYVNSTLYQMYPQNASQAQFEFNQLMAATCGCDTVAMNSSGLLFGNQAFLALNNSADFFDPSTTFSNLTDMGGYRAKYCSYFGQAAPVFMDYATYNYTLDGSQIPVGTTPTGNFTTNTTLEVPYSNSTAYCIKWLNNTLNWRQNQTLSVQKLLIDQRLGDQRTTGKIASRNTVINNMRNFLLLNYPELVDPVFTSPKGSVALQDPIQARVDVLAAQFVDGVTLSTQPQRAFLNLTRKNVYNPNVTLLALAERATARISEVYFQGNETLDIIMPTPLSNVYSNMSIAEIMTAYLTAGATNFSVPDNNDTRLGDLRTDYNLVTWDGNTTAYMVCSLNDPFSPRGKEYEGSCVDMNNTCVVSNNDTIPYNCTYVQDGVNTNITIPGNLSDSNYRSNCETPCDRLLDCSTLCECYGTCSTYQYCECDACIQLNLNAAADTQFVDIMDVAKQAGDDAAVIALAPVNGEQSRRRGRSLQQSDVTDQLTQVLTQVSAVKTQQDSIASQMSKLQSQVDTANRLAEARANDNRLIDLISAGRSDIQAGQARVEAKLDEIIGKQNQALAAAEDAAKALSAIQDLAQKQLQAQQALEKAVQNQLTAIKTATYQRIISLTQALALWKRARRDRALTIKAAKLANTPCTSAPSVDNEFSLSNGNLLNYTTARERNIGLTNRVIAGLLVYQWRTNETECAESKFDKIQKTCTGPTTVKSFGVDPVFKSGTTLYDQFKNDLGNTIVVSYYNCSDLPTPTYDVWNSVLNKTTNPYPYCAELYNPQEVPYAFHHIPLEHKESGFPVYFDINLSEDGAQSWFTYISEGLYLDQHTRGVTAELVTYNAQLRIFGYYYLKFYFSDGGSVQVSYRLNTVRVELYNSYDDNVRFGLEIILSGWICLFLLYTFYCIAMAQKEQGNFLKYFSKGWNWIDFISNSLLFACMVLWWVIVDKYAKPFSINLRYEVYDSLNPDANYLALKDSSSEGMVSMWQAFYDLQDLIDMFNWYFALNGINILLLIARVLKLMDFQPRLGVVTRSLWLAGPDLIHFAIVAGMVFVGYAMMAHLIFGNAIEAFATFGDSINTCFEILLGNIDVNNDLRALGGLQSVAGALFFWSYELLVFMVLLNFLLAIIVDAFSEVKEKTHETVGIHTELFQLFRDKWRSLLGRCTSNYISDAKLGQLLKQWAGEDGEEDEQKAVDDGKKLLMVLNEELTEDDLRTILMECLKDAPGAEEDDDSKAVKKSILTRCLPGKGKKVVASPTEVALAAKYIVDRFGAPPAEDDDEFGGDEVAVADGGAVGGLKEVALEKERDQLAQALERLAEVQRELAEGQRNLMAGQKQLAEQQAKLVTLMNTDAPGSSGN